MASDSLTQSDLSLTRLLANTDKLSQSGKAALAVALLRDSSNPSSVPALLDSLITSMRVQGRTAYVTWGSGSQDPAQLASALGLHALTLAKNTNPLVEKLANFMALVRPPPLPPFNPM